MNWTRYAIAVVVVFLVTMTMGFVIHGLILGADYQSLGSLMRSEQDAMAHFLFNILSHLAIALGVVWIYAKGVEPKPWLGQGLRFGLAFWLIGSVGVYLIYFAVMPLPAALVTKQIAAGLPENLILGMVLAALYRKG
jgi:hypothetical protein